MSDRRNVPFKSLGLQLQGLRQKLQESLAEVAGAVEIEESQLERIEEGTERPSEDILMLLINHFGIHEDEATSLWLLAGYDASTDTENEPGDVQTPHSTVVMMMMDARILYSDQAQVAADKHGVVLSFMQNALGPIGNQQKLPVARIGMSYEQAHDLLAVLHKTLRQADYLRQPRRLSAPDGDNKPKRPPTSGKK